MKNLLITFSMIVLVSTYALGQNSCDYGTLDNGANVTLACPGSIQLNGKIDGKSQATLISQTGNIYITEKIDGKSVVTLEARGQVTIGWVIDGNSTVTIKSKGDIEIKDKIDGGSICDFNTDGDIVIIGKVDNDATTIRWHGKSFTVKGYQNPKCKIIQY